MEIRTDLISGLWKFKDSTPKEELEAFADELAKDDHYIHVYIRKVSKDQNGVGVTYKSDVTIGKQEFSDYMDKMKDVLYKKFGVSLAGWDFSSSTTTFKGF